MALYIDKNDIEEPEIIGKTIRLPKNKYPGDILKKMHKFTGSENYASSIINKSKYTVIGSGAGMLIGIGLAMFFKKGKWGGAILGAVGGAFAGYWYMKLAEKAGVKNQETATTTTK